ncbi:MAG: methionyl-tRNA formyltransferase [Candidatus Saccharibacteria bacterium]
MSKKILFFGNERLATGLPTTAPVFRALLEAGYDIAAVIVAQVETGPSRKGRPLEIAELAKQHNIPVHAPAKLSDITDELATYQAEAAILIAYGDLVPAAIIDLFPRGIINLHPSLLPKHRGPIPIESVILNGEVSSGISLMALVKEMDAGPLYAQVPQLLIGTETKQQLADMFLDAGQELLLQHLPAILDGSLQPTPQPDDPTATYDERIKKEAGRIDWQKPAVQLEREVRAYLGWPRSRTKLGNYDVIVTAAHVIDGSGAPGSLYLEDKQLGIHSGEGILIIDSLVPAGKKEMSAQAFRAGYKLA